MDQSLKSVMLDKVQPISIEILEDRLNAPWDLFRFTEKMNSVCLHLFVIAIEVIGLDDEEYVVRCLGSNPVLLSLRVCHHKYDGGLRILRRSYGDQFSHNRKKEEVDGMNRLLHP